MTPKTPTADPLKLFTLNPSWKPAGDQAAAVAALSNNIQQGHKKQTLEGITGSGKTFTIAKTIETLQRQALVLVHNKTLATQLYGEFKEFFPHNAVEYFVSYFDFYQPEAYAPSSDTYIEKTSVINEKIEQLRLSATKSLVERKDVIIVATVSAIYGIGNPGNYKGMACKLFRGQKFTEQELIRRLTAMQYTRNNTLLERGQFRSRGEHIDIYPAENQDRVIRVQISDDLIEKITPLDSLTSKSVGEIQHFTVFPKNHYVTEKSRVLSIIPEIQAELEPRLKHFQQAGKLVEKQRLEQRVNHDLEMMNELGFCKGIENYSRYLSGGGPGEPPACLLNYLDKDALVVIDESHVTVPQLGGMYHGDYSRKKTLVDFGFRLPSALDNRPLKFEEFEAFPFSTIYVSATPGTHELNKSQGRVVQQIMRPTGLLDPVIEVRPAISQVDDLMGEISKTVKKKERILVTTLTKKQAEDLATYLQENGIKAKYLHSEIDTIERHQILNDLRKGAFDCLVGINLLREGLDLPEVSLVGILDADKEGFLRSEKALTQTIGRAARNVHGKAILYADKQTTSMKATIKATLERREKQTLYNHEHGIVPRAIQKQIHDVVSHAGPGRENDAKNKSGPELHIEHLSFEELESLYKELKAKMKEQAKNLQFEQAARSRDQLKTVEGRMLKAGQAQDEASSFYPKPH